MSEDDLDYLSALPATIAIIMHAQTIRELLKHIHVCLTGGMISQAKVDQRELRFVLAHLETQVSILRDMIPIDPI